MQDKPRRTIELKLLTASRDVGLRRLRNFAAPIGGRAEIVTNVDDLLQKIAINALPRTATIVITDGSFEISAAKGQLLAEKARVFHLIPHRGLLQLASAGSIGAEFYAEATLQEFFDSPMIRRSLPQLVEWPVQFEAGALLGWGNTTALWQASSGTDLTDEAQKFHRGIGLTGPGRRMIEMFSHHAVTRLPMLRMALQEVSFGSDGILVTMALRCTPTATGKLDFALIANELRNHQLPMTVINNRGPAGVDLVGLVYPSPGQSTAVAGGVILINAPRANDVKTEIDPLLQAV